MTRAQEMCRDLADELGPWVDVMRDMDWDGSPMSKGRDIRDFRTASARLVQLRSLLETFDDDVFWAVLIVKRAIMNGRIQRHAPNQETAAANIDADTDGTASAVVQGDDSKEEETAA